MSYITHPSILATKPAPNVSDKYRFIPTIDIVNTLVREGFTPSQISVANVRKSSNRDYAKHLIRFRHNSNSGNGDQPEIILINSHNGTSSNVMMTGFFRFVCANGLICGDPTTIHRIRHTHHSNHEGQTIDDYIEAAYEVIQDFDTQSQQIETFRSTQLTRLDAIQFAADTMEALDFAPKIIVNYAPRLSNMCRRTEDQSLDLWTTLNRVQEHLLKGGIILRSRAIKSIDRQVKVNQTVWNIARNWSLQ